MNKKITPMKKPEFSIEMLSRDPEKAILEIVKFLQKNHDYFFSSDGLKMTRTSYYIDIIRILDLVVKKTNDNPAKSPLSEIASLAKKPRQYNYKAVAFLYDEVLKLNELSMYDTYFTTKENEPIFQISSDEAARVSNLCSEMRSIIIESNLIEDSHKKRLMNRISQIEQEIYQKIGKLDTVLGGIVDVGDALGKFGKSLEPLVNKMKEIRKITQGKSSEYKELPPPDETKQLPSPGDFPEE